MRRMCDANGTWSGLQPVCIVDSIMPKAYLVMLIVGAIVTVFLACIPYDFYRFRKRKKKVRDHQERLSLVTRIAPGHAKVIVETVPSEDGDAHHNHHHRKFGFKSLLSVFKFMAGGKLKAGNHNEHSDGGGETTLEEGEGTLEEGEEGGCTRMNGYQSVPTSSPKTCRGHGAAEQNHKASPPLVSVPSAKSLVMKPHICRHKSVEHHAHAPLKTLSSHCCSLDLPASSSSPAAPSQNPSPCTSSSSAAAAGVEPRARPGLEERSLTLDLTEIITPASDSGTPTPTMSAPTPKPMATRVHLCSDDGATGVSLQQGGIMYPYAYSPDYEEIETPRRGPNFFRGGAPPATNRTSSSGNLVMGGAFGGRPNRPPQQQGSYPCYGSGRPFNYQPEPYEDYHSASSSSSGGVRNYGTGAVPKREPTARSGLLVFQKASEIFHRRLEAKRDEESAKTNAARSPGVREDHWSFTESSTPDITFSSDDVPEHGSINSPPVEATPREALSMPPQRTKNRCSKTNPPPASDRSCIETSLPHTNVSITSRGSPSVRTHSSQTESSAPSLKPLTKTFSQQTNEDLIADASSVDTQFCQAQIDPKDIAPVLGSCLSREEVNCDEIETGSSCRQRYSMPFLADSPTMRDEERSSPLELGFIPISAPRDSFTASAQTDLSPSRDGCGLSSRNPVSSSQGALFDPHARNFPDLISNENCSFSQDTPFIPSKDTTFAPSNSSGKTTPEGSDSTVIMNTGATSPKDDNRTSPSQCDPAPTFSFSTDTPLSPSILQTLPASRDNLSSPSSAQHSTFQGNIPDSAFSQNDIVKGSNFGRLPSAKTLTRTGSCSSPLTVFPVFKRTSPPSSSSSPDVLQLKKDSEGAGAPASHRATAFRFPGPASNMVASHGSMPSVYCGAAGLARHASLENP